MTNHWIDIGNADVIMIIGSNAAENHPISWRWVEKAREKNGAKVISVDPRYTRTSAQSDIFVPLRSGTDIAFIGGMIKHIIENECYNRDYVAEYTNGSFLVDNGDNSETSSASLSASANWLKRNGMSLSEA